MDLAANSLPNAPISNTYNEMFTEQLTEDRLGFPLTDGVSSTHSVMFTTVKTP